MLNKVLVLGASAIQLPLILELKGRGFYVYAISNIKNDQASKEADEFHNISSTNFPKIKDLIENENISNAFSIGSDLALRTLTKLASYFSWGNHPKTEDFEFLHNKAKVRERLYEAGISKIQCKCVKEYSENLFDFEEHEQWVIKPVDGYGSKGIYHIEEYQDKEKYFKLAIANSIEGKVIVEPFIQGKQLVAEFFVDENGRVSPMMSIEKKNNSAFVPYLYLIRDNADYKKKLIRISGVLDLKAGFYNVDLIETKRGVELMDIAPRLGGNHLPLLYKYTFGTNSITDYVNFVFEGTTFEQNKKAKNTGLYIIHHSKGGKIATVNEHPQFLNVLEEKYWVEIGQKIEAFKQGNQQQGYIIFEMPKQVPIDEIDMTFENNPIIEITD